MKRPASQSGYTLVESIAFICIITMVAISIISVVSHMLDRYKTSRITAQVVELQKAINTRFASAENYEKLTAKLLKDENLAPGDMNWKGNNMYHKFGGTVVVGSSYTSNVMNIRAGETYSIRFNGVPYIACKELVTQNWAHDQYSSLVVIVSRSANLWAYWRTPSGLAPSRKHLIMPLSLSNVDDMCPNKTNRGNNLEWVFQ